jgi:hypothetical protein
MPSDTLIPALSTGQPDPSEDVLRGVSEIGAFIGEDDRRTYYLLEKKIIPAGKEGNLWRASKRRLRRHYDRLTAGGADAAA